MKKLERGVQPSHMSFKASPCWLQVHNLPPNWRKTSIVTKIIERASKILEFDVYSLENIFAKAVRIKMELNLKKPLVLGVKIPLSAGRASPRVVWIDFRYEKLLIFCYYCGLITHDAKAYLSGSGFIVGFGVSMQGLETG